MAGARIRSGFRCGALLALALALAPAAVAEPVVGTGLVVAKDVGDRTVTLTPAAVLHLDRGTRILDADGSPLPLAALAVARRVGGGFEAEGDAMVRYRASRRGEKLLAAEIRVLGVIPR